MIHAAESIRVPSFSLDIGLPGWTVLTWTIAGGVMTGGGWVLVLVATGAVDPVRAGSLAGFLFFFGAIVGVAHGLVLGIVGRPAGRSVAWAMGSAAIGLFLTIPALAGGWVLSHAIAEVPAAQAFGGMSALAASGLFWGIGAAICFLAAYEGFRALCNAYGRWPDCKVGSFLLVVLLGILAVQFVSDQPALWGTEIQVTGFGAVLLALGATIWLGAPAIVVALMVAHRLHRDADTA
jgi:hypothetical protein